MRDVARLLWTRRGERRIPSLPAFDAAVSKLRKGELERLCEFGPHGPIYLILTRPFLRELAKTIRGLGVKNVLEVAAGDGHLGRSLQRTAPDLRVRITDSGAWEKPEARMSKAERAAKTRAAGLRLRDDVERLPALTAIERYQPQLVLASWVPPGPLLGKLIRAAPLLLEIGAGSGITGDIRCWRYPHDFLEGRLEQTAHCRLDDRPRRRLHTRITLYGAALY